MNALKYPSLEEKSNEELFLLYKENHAQEVKQELTMRYVYIVRSIAYQMREMYHDFMQTDDIVNEGVIEIMRAIERYDENRDNKFETYISRRIRGMV
ncbi:MAG: FliA/WhiG family RNA polymerase sigma factor, partial [Oribacterium parvum]|nr:FliA/WhiG family RNA polymerase sigma factor [Oribacterium parvum]